MKKSVIAILMTAIIFASLFVPLLLAQAYTSTTNGVTVDGVLASDSYVLYPYSKTNLYLGISKYGELINGEASTKVGLKYGTMDVFANPNVLEKDWSQGWFIDIHYVDANDNYKRAWAFAMYSDLTDSNGIGGVWKENCTGGPTETTVQGGRKTNVWATSAPIQVLYDGPREFIAQTNTTIYAATPKTAENALVGVVLTFVFDKDKKCVVVFKDIKRLDAGKFTRPFQIEFSNRGEWDIGTSSAPPSNAYFFDNLPTVYDADYHYFYKDAGGSIGNLTGFDVVQMLNTEAAPYYVGYAAFWPQLYGKLVAGTTDIKRDTILQSLCTVEKNYTWAVLDPDAKTITFSLLGWPAADDHLIGLGAVDDSPMVFKNGVLLDAGGVDYTWTTGSDIITFVIEPLATDYITVVYKHQVNPGAMDMASEPDTPYVIGEWVFDLRNQVNKTQFRAVTMYGLTDKHDAVDDTVIDSEVQYMLNETFNPWDLYAAMEKEQYSWVDIRTLTSTTATNNITLTTGLNDKLYYVPKYVANPPSGAPAYGPERVAVGGTTTGSGGWTGYFIRRDAGDYALRASTWVNKLDLGSDYMHSKNWALKLGRGRRTRKSRIPEGHAYSRHTNDRCAAYTEAQRSGGLRGLVQDYWCSYSVLRDRSLFYPRPYGSWSSLARPRQHSGHSALHRLGILQETFGRECWRMGLGDRLYWQ